MRLASAAALALLLGAATAGVSADVAVPPLHARVTDLTGTLTRTQAATLEQELAAFETRKGAQLAILMLPTTQPETIEQYGIRVADAWKLGRKGIDDAVILLVAKNDRKLRFEVGYGLEGAVPDVVANRIISEVIVPFFKQGDYYGGIQAGITRLIRVIDGEPLPPPSARDTGWVAGWEQALPFAFIAVFVLGGILRAIFGRLLGASLASGISIFVIWLVLGSLVISLVLGVLVFFFSIIFGMQNRGGYGGWSSRPGGFGGFGGGGFGGGGFGGGGFGGGGFSGGGGGFGGGGASGSW